MRRRRARNEFDDSDDNESGITTSVPETPDVMSRRESRQASVAVATAKTNRGTGNNDNQTGAAAEREALQNLKDLFEDAEFRDILTPGPVKDKKAELKRLRAEKVVEYEADLRDRFAGEHTDQLLSPTKKRRLMADVRRAAERRARRDEQEEEHVRDLYVFDTRRSGGAVNSYTKVLENSDRLDGWYMFMRDEDMRQWFFASSMYERFKSKTFPDWDDACALWVQEELSREKKDALREKYADVWVSVVSRSVKKETAADGPSAAGLLWDRCEALLKSVGLKATGDDNPDVWMPEYSHYVAHISDDLLHQWLKPAETVIRCVTKACCRYLRGQNPHEDNFHVAQKLLQTLLLICGSDCMVGTIGLSSIGESVAAIVETLTDNVWTAVSINLSTTAIFITKHAKSAHLNSIPLRILSNLDQAVTAACQCGDTGRRRIGRLHQQLAINFWLGGHNACDNDIEIVLERQIIPCIEKKPLYKMLTSGSRQAAMAMITKHADTLKQDCLLLTHAIRGLPYINVLTSNATKDAQQAEARGKLAAWIQRQLAIVQLADPGRDRPHLYGYAIALQSAEAVISANFVRTLTGIF